MARMIHPNGSDGIVALAKIRVIGFTGIEDSHPGIEAVRVAVAGVNQEIRLIAQFQGKPLG